MPHNAERPAPVWAEHGPSQVVSRAADGGKDRPKTFTPQRSAGGGAALDAIALSGVIQ